MVFVTLSVCLKILEANIIFSSLKLREDVMSPWNLRYFLNLISIWDMMTSKVRQITNSSELSSETRDWISFKLSVWTERRRNWAPRMSDEAALIASMSAPCPAITSRTTSRRLATSIFARGISSSGPGTITSESTPLSELLFHPTVSALSSISPSKGSLFGSRMLHPFGCDDVKLPQKNRGGKACGGNEVPRVHHVVLDCSSRPRQSTWFQLMMASLHWSSTRSLSAVLLGIVSSPSSASLVEPAIRLQNFTFSMKCV